MGEMPALENADNLAIDYNNLNSILEAHKNQLAPH